MFKLFVSPVTSLFGTTIHEYHVPTGNTFELIPPFIGVTANVAPEQIIAVSFATVIVGFTVTVTVNGFPVHVTPLLIMLGVTV